MEINLADINIRRMAEEIKAAASQSETEEDFKVPAEHILRKYVLDRFNIPWGKYERGVFVSGVRGRSDVLYGHVLIEYEKPGVLASKIGREDAIDQVRKYIRGHAKFEKALPRYFGVAFDGFQIAFIRYRETEKVWITQGPYNVGPDTLLRLLEAIRGLTRRPLDADYLIDDFGPGSGLARDVVATLCRKLANAKSERTKTLFRDWKRVFSQVCAYSPEKIRGLEESYELSKKTDPEELLFSVHTYYALVMKLLAAEVASLFGEPFLQSYVRKLEDAYLTGHSILKSELEDLEEGGIFLKIGIANFLEADYFSWYLNDWDPDIAKVIVDVVKRLSNYEVGTAELEPERIKDLFKRLYQFLVPKDIRHDLGEYYTPDWLADLVLNEVGYDGDPSKRLLDPSCGSGTFLVLAIKRIKEYAWEHHIDPGELLEKVTENIVGFDLNPLAVMASRANYLIALGDAIRYRKKEGFRIPVYLADSILVERKTSIFGDSYTLGTVVGEFAVPVSVVEKGKLEETLGLVERCVKGRYNRDEFKESLQKDIKGLSESDVWTLGELFDTLSKLEKQDRNRIWTRVLKNSFAPLFEEKFDYVVGNPPWINWESLPEKYREATKSLWQGYGLIQKAKAAALGKVKRDIAMLFVTVGVDRYLNANGNGKLSLLVPFTLFKTQAGAGFRNYLARKTEVKKVHDLVELTPFEGAINRTSLLTICQGKTSFPVPCTSWSKQKGLGINFGMDLNEVEKITNRADMVLDPMEGESKPESSWLILRAGAKDAVKKATGQSRYEAHAGVYTALNSAYWIEIISKQPKGLLVRNLATIGKKKVNEVKEVVEPALVYPLIRGRDVKMWCGEPAGYMLVPHNARTGEPLEKRTMRVDYPQGYTFLATFEDQLELRSIHKLWGKGRPFYSLYDIGSYTFKPYKIMWKYVAGKISGKGQFSVAVIPPVKDKWVGEKPVIPNEKLMLIPFDKANEAYFMAAILNFPAIRLAVAGYTIETAISTHVVKHVKVPNFEPKNPVHQKLSKLSKKAHELAAKGFADELHEVEKDINSLVAGIYGLSDADLKECIESLRILEGKPEEMEEEEEELPQPTEPHV